MASQRPAPLSRQDYVSRWSELHGGVDPADSKLISGYLRLMYALARPFVALGASPNAVTLTGLLVAVLAIWAVATGGRWVLAAVAAIAVSGLLDGVDGAVAVVTGRTSRWGAVLDSLVDRLQEACYLIALHYAGAPAWICAAGGAAVWLAEYVRAKAAAVGMTEVGIVTPFERPTRIAVAAMFLLAGAIYPVQQQWWATAGAALWLALALVSLGMLIPVVRRRLNAGQGPDAEAGEI